VVVTVVVDSALFSTGGGAGAMKKEKEIEGGLWWF
jgi:hypothetical protein